MAIESLPGSELPPRPQDPAITRLFANSFDSRRLHHLPKAQPLSVGRVFPFPLCWRAFRTWPRERRPCEVGDFATAEASLLPSFSGGHASVLAATFFTGADLEAIGRGWRSRVTPTTAWNEHSLIDEISAPCPSGRP